MDLFISKMNEVAKNIGMLNSNFKNPSGSGWFCCKVEFII